MAVIKQMTRHFSPNGDGRRDVSRIRVRVRKDDDVTITIVDEADNEVRRLATGVPAVARQSVRVRWDGRTERGRPGARGRLPRARRAAPRRPRGDARARAPARHDRPAPDACSPAGRTAASGSRARSPAPVPFRVRVVSQRFPTSIRVLRTDAGEPEQVATFELPPGEREGEWDGRAGGRARAARDLPARGGGARRRGQRRALRPGRSDGRARCAASPGVSVRGLLAQPPADPVRAGELVRRSPSTRAGARTAGASSASARPSRGARGARRRAAS